MSYESETRTLRNRMEAQQASVDRNIAFPSSGTPRIAVQIADGGNMPTSNDHYFLAHPVQYGGNETEGGSATTWVNTDVDILVDVIGGQVPAVGERMIANLIGGRWVAQARKGDDKTCCNWFCFNAPAVPDYIDVVDPKFGTFRLPRAKNGSSCAFALDTYFDWDGDGSCAAGRVPVHLAFTGDSGPHFSIHINQIQSVGFNPPVDAPPHTTCTYPHPIVGTFNTVSFTCPTVDQTFPVDLTRNICLNQGVLNVPVTCGSGNPWTFSGSATISPWCGGGTIYTNPLYYLYYGCGGADFASIPLTWNFVAGPTKNIGCTCCLAPCSNVSIAQKDFRLDWTSSLGAATSGSVVLRYGKAPQWRSDSFDPGNPPGTIIGFGGPYHVEMFCRADIAGVEVDLYLDRTGTLLCRNVFCHFDAGDLRPGCLEPTSYSFSPVSLAFNNEFIPGRGTPCDGIPIKSITITDPNPPDPSKGLMCQTICAPTCIYSLTHIGPVEITVFDSQGGKQLATGTVDETTGCVHLAWSGQPGNYWVTVTAAGMPCNKTGAQYPMICGGTTTVSFASICMCDTLTSINATFRWTQKVGNTVVLGPCTSTGVLPPYGTGPAPAAIFAGYLDSDDPMACGGPFMRFYVYSQPYSCSVGLNYAQWGGNFSTRGSCSPFNELADISFDVVDPVSHITSTIQGTLTLTGA